MPLLTIILLTLFFFPLNALAESKIAFTSTRDGNYEIYTMNPDGTNQTRLTNNPAEESGPFWSPGGSKIGFSTGRDGNFEIYTMNPDGTNQSRLTNNSALDAAASWSPDGTKIVFTSDRDGNYEIYVMNTDGTNQTRLTNNSSNDGEARWSPDGSKIVFSSWRSGAADIWVMNSNGSNPVQLTSGAWAQNPVWSPDGTKIAYSATGAVRLMNADGTNKTVLLNVGCCISPNLGSWSPDGTKLAIFSELFDGNSEIYTINSDGTNRINISNNSASDLYPQWATIVPAELPRTGQTTCYDSAGVVINCPGTGQDGEIQAGVPWPDPRFIDNADGTVTDNLTGLMWTQDGNAPGPAACSPGTYKTWQDALNYVACLNTNSYLGYTDWRLPNRIELGSLINAGQGNMATWLNTQGFSNVQSTYYWSSTSVALYPGHAWIVYMWYGGMSSYDKSYNFSHVWPVRSGQSGSFGSSVIQLPRTGQTTCYDSGGAVIACAGTGQDGEIQAGVPWPDPRFTDNGDATVADNLTGLMWTQDGNAPGPAACSPGTYKTWQDALNYVACLNTNSYLGYTDWRLPNRIELGSLINAGQGNMATWLNTQGFSNVQSSYDWSSTSYAGYPYYAWIVSMWDGYMGDRYKSNDYYVWPVRSGQSGSLDNSILLSQATGDQQSQTVAWNDVGNEYFALWQDFRNGSGNPDIYGARLDIDGNVIATDLPIVTQTAKQAGPWVSYGGGSYLAVWIDQRNMSTTGTDVYGAWILPDGTVSSEFIVTNASANQRAASVIYNPTANNFLVTWIDDTNGASDVNIQGAVVNPGGGVGSGPFAMVTTTGNQRGPYVRYDYGNSQYFMVWFDNRNGDNDVYGSRVSASGTLLDGSGLVISNASGNQNNPRITDRRPADGISNFVLSWIDLRNGQADIYGALIDEFGTKTGSDIQIAGGSYDQRASSIDVDYLRTGQAVVSWIDNRNGTDYDIYRAQVDQSGTVSGEALVAGAGTGAANNQQGPLVTYSEDNGADNGFLLSWRDNRSGVDYDLYGIKVWP